MSNSTLASIVFASMAMWFFIIAATGNVYAGGRGGRKPLETIRSGPIRLMALAAAAIFLAISFVFAKHALYNWQP